MDEKIRELSYNLYNEFKSGGWIYSDAAREMADYAHVAGPGEACKKDRFFYMEVKRSLYLLATRDSLEDARKAMQESKYSERLGYYDLLEWLRNGRRSRRHAFFLNEAALYEFDADEGTDILSPVIRRAYKREAEVIFEVVLDFLKWKAEESEEAETA